MLANWEVIVMEVEIVWLAPLFILTSLWDKPQVTAVRLPNSNCTAQWARFQTWDLSLWELHWIAKLMDLIHLILFDKIAAIYNNSRLITLSNFIRPVVLLGTFNKFHCNPIVTQDRPCKVPMISKMHHLFRNLFRLLSIRFLSITNLRTKLTVWR